VPSVFVDNTGSFKLVGLSNGHQLIADAAPSFIIVDKTGTAISDPAVMVAINQEPGSYRGIIPAATPLVERKQYRIVVDVEISGKASHYEMPFTAETRVG
jgi:hypothetical protein